MNGQAWILAGLAGAEAIAGIWLLTALWSVRMLRAQTRGQLAAAIAKRRAVEDPEIPREVLDCLRTLVADANDLSAGRRMFGQAFADKLRVTVRIPDNVLAVVLHEVLLLAGKVERLETDHDFAIVVQALSAAAVELSSLELELTR